MPKPLRILYAENSKTDFLQMRALLRACLGDAFLLTWAADAEEAVAEIRDGRHDLYLVDFGVSAASGMDFIIEAMRSGSAAPCIVVTDSTQPDIDSIAVRAGAADYLLKSELSAPVLARSIRYALLRQQKIAEERKSKGELESSHAKLNALYRTAHQFVDDVSHEFRTPLTVIREFASILHDGIGGPLNAEQQEFLEIIMNRVDDMSHMVDDMLDISKLEADMLGVLRRRCTVDEIVERVLATLERKARASKVRFEIRIAPQLPDVFCDPENIGRVLMNLAVNACKFSGENGRVVLRASKEPGAAQVRFGVEDNGPGIAPELTEEIFERFKQVGADLRSSSKGFGLGLNIAKELVKVNFGRITVRSEVGHGSNFEFTVPVADHVVIGTCFWEHVAQFDPNAKEVALISVELKAPADRELCRDLERCIHQQLRRSDVLLPLEPGAWLICAALAPADQPSLIAARLENALAASTLRQRQGFAFLLTPIASWRIADQKSQFLDGFCAAIDQPMSRAAAEPERLIA